MTAERHDRAAGLLERLLVDPQYRAAFRRSPAEAAVAAGLDDVADELRRPDRALQTLELRESRSSLAGVLMAAAAEGIGIAEFVGFLHSRGSLSHDAAGALHGALERASVQNAAASAPPAPDPIDVHPQHLAAAAAAPGAIDPGAVDAPVPPAAVAPAAAPVDAAPADVATAAAPQPPVAAPADGVANPSATPEAPAGATAPAATAPSGPSAVDPATTDLSDPQPAAAGAAPVAALPAEPAPVATAAATAPAPTGDAAAALVEPAAASPGGAAAAPVDPADMRGSNAGGKLHGSEYAIADREGADGIHAGYDLFGRPGAAVHAPAAGTIVEVKRTGRTSGQVFGDAVKLQTPDGRVWVFRHVEARVEVGDRLRAGDPLASIVRWSDDPESSHTHIELWKTLDGGYHRANMVDPYTELQHIYAGGGGDHVAAAAAAAPVEAGTKGAGAAGAIAADPVAAPAAAATGAPVTAVDIAHDGRIQLSEPALNRLRMTVDPRVLDLLHGMAGAHSLRVTHIDYDSIEIASVDGKAVTAQNMAARDLVTALASATGPQRPAAVGSPWAISGEGFYQDPAHRGLKITLAPRLGGAGLFTPAAAHTAGVFPSVGQAPAAGAGAENLASAFSGGGANAYPGNDAPKWQIADWMAREAVKQGLPPELPVMAALQESSLTWDTSPDEYGSIGYFQLIPSWGAQQKTPEAQLAWFLRGAVGAKADALRGGDTTFGKDPAKWWEWIANVERPAAQYRNLYQRRLPEAQELLQQAAQHRGASAGQAFENAAAVPSGAVGSSRTVVAAAMSQLGVPYSWGGGGPGGPGGGFDQGRGIIGFDCSSLMQYAMSKEHVSIPRVAQDQFDASAAHRVGMSGLQPGDLVFFGSSTSRIHHVGMYIGGGRFIHAPHTGDHVKISQLSGYYANEFQGGGRFT